MVPSQGETLFSSSCTPVFLALEQTSIVSKGKEFVNKLGAQRE